MEEILEETKSFVERHPYWIGGSLVALLVLFLISRNASSSSVTNSSTGTVTESSGPDDAVTVAQLQASSASLASQNAAQLANNQLAAQLQSQQMTDATQIALAQIAHGLPVTIGTTPATPPVATPPSSTPVSTTPTVTGGCTGTSADFDNPNCNAGGVTVSTSSSPSILSSILGTGTPSSRIGYAQTL